MRGNQDHDTRHFGPVQAFYERFPYPPPLDDLEAHRSRWDDARRRADFHRFWPTQPYRDNFSILVAGCGTAQAAKHALRWPNAHVTGIDVSATSIEHTERLKGKYRLDNLDVHRLPLECASELDQLFDQVVCTGVLHHLEDPALGLKALRAVLAPDGALQLMLYAPYGRAGIYLLQEFFRRVGADALSADIHDVVAALKVLPAAHPLTRLLQEAPDFRSEAGIADALLHPSDRAYTVPQVFALLAECGLSFARWHMQAPYSFAAGLLSRLPDTLRPAPGQQDAAAELFRGTMLSHSAIAFRDDAPQVPILFAGDAWPGIVPIRMPDTIAVEQNLPPGAAAVLINRVHAFTDIFLPVDAREKALVDTIDGRRTIADIASVTRCEIEFARTLFEKLWWHDQVVFDAWQVPATTRFP